MLCGGSAVTLAHGAGDPGEVDVVGESAERGDDSTAATACLEFAVRLDVIFHGAAVGGKDEPLTAEEIVDEF